jgi:hypothetical protein
MWLSWLSLLRDMGVLILLPAVYVRHRPEITSFCESTVQLKINIDNQR